MNLIGHVLAAARAHEAPRVLFGAMLPDLAHIAGLTLLRPTCADVVLGIQHHRAVDSIFHELPRFAALRRELRALLTARGVSKGPREAVAHAGVELLLDGAYIREEDASRAYVAAAGAARALEPEEAGWPSREGYIVLVGRLTDPTLPAHYADVDRVTDMLVRVLARRPRLRASEAEADAIRDELHEIQGRVLEQAEPILRDVIDRLGRS